MAELYFAAHLSITTTHLTYILFTKGVFEKVNDN